LLPTLPARIALDVKADDGAVFVTGSAVQLSQIVIHLCTKARDAPSGWGGKIQLALGCADRNAFKGLAAGAGEAWIGEIDSNRRYACIRVIDDGEGPAGSSLPRIFEPFFTTKGAIAARSSVWPWSMVHGAVVAHQGICHVRSELGVGTTISIYLPLPDSALHKEIRKKDVAMLGNERVLLVDDEIDIVETVSRGLTRMGYLAVGTDDPREVVRAIEEDGVTWDVIITDQMMPALTGLELIKKIKALRPELLIILCTGHGQATDEQSALKAGADAYVRKPADAAVLARCIRRLRAERCSI
jgi:two-component system cell cycle sensor histidine kinase/response regulator CckA